VPDDPSTLPLDLIVACLYTLASMVDVQLRACKGCDPKSDLQAQAGLHIAYVALLLGLIFFMLSQWIVERQRPDRSLTVDILSRSRSFQTRATFLIIIIAQLSLWENYISNITDSITSTLFVSLLMAIFIFAPSTFAKILTFIYLWWFLLGVHWKDMLTKSPIWLNSSPRTGAKITDAYQIILFGATAITIMARWKVVSRILEGVSAIQRLGQVRRQDEIPLSATNVAT
jgi:hypothetical protein